MVPDALPSQRMIRAISMVTIFSAAPQGHTVPPAAISNRPVTCSIVTGWLLAKMQFEVFSGKSCRPANPVARKH